MFSFRFRAPSSSAPFDLASIPNESSTSLNYRSYAFVEFRSTRDAEDAYYDMYVPSAFPFFQHLIFQKNKLSQAWTHVRGFAPRYTGGLMFLNSGFLTDGSFSHTFSLLSVGQEPSIVCVANR